MGTFCASAGGDGLKMSSGSLNCSKIIFTKPIPSFSAAISELGGKLTSIQEANADSYLSGHSISVIDCVKTSEGSATVVVTHKSIGSDPFSKTQFNIKPVHPSGEECVVATPFLRWPAFKCETEALAGKLVEAVTGCNANLLCE